MGNIKKESGQTAVIVFFLLVVGLAVGVSVSSNYVKSLRMSKEMDLASRAIGIAEAGVERMLAEQYSVLVEYIANNSCGSACVLEITDPKGVVSRADIHLSHIGGSEEPFLLDLNTQDTSQVELSGYSDNTDLYVCWNATAEEPSIVGLYVYGDDSGYFVDNYAYNTSTSPYSYNGFDSASSSLGYENCFTVDGKTKPVMLRLKSVYSGVSAYVLPASGQILPSQGILIESAGQIFETVKTVRVLRTKSALPAQFDYALYQRSETDPLSN
ncbi:MAG: hypothetical protein WC243_01430 [Patescibacteria group bacterium]|jgi:hypothetical protein